MQSISRVDKNTPITGPTKDFETFSNEQNIMVTILLIKNLQKQLKII